MNSDIGIQNGNSMPNITLLIPLADILEITVTELLNGKKSNDNLQESMDLTISNAINQQKKKWTIAFIVSVIIVGIETICLLNTKNYNKQILDSLFISLIMLACAGWFCFLAKDLLPVYYDQNKINYISQGIFKIHMIGLSFNNSNWPYILVIFKIFSLAIAILLPIYCYIIILIGGVKLWSDIKNITSMVLLAILFISIYIIGRKYK